MDPLLAHCSELATRPWPSCTEPCLPHPGFSPEPRTLGSWGRYYDLLHHTDAESWSQLCQGTAGAFLKMQGVSGHSCRVWHLALLCLYAGPRTGDFSQCRLGVSMAWHMLSSHAPLFWIEAFHTYTSKLRNQEFDSMKAGCHIMSFYVN